MKELSIPNKLRGRMYPGSCLDGRESGSCRKVAIQPYLLTYLGYEKHKAKSVN
jgi:hypothetical protein